MGRVWPRHEQRGRPLNAIVRQHLQALGDHLGKAFNTAVREQFASALKAQAPQFVAAETDSRFAWPGERAFVWRRTETTWLWISLICSIKGYNDFSVEVGWSGLGRYPNLESRPSIAAMERIAPRDDAEFVCDIASIAGCPAIWEPPAKLVPGMSEVEQIRAQSAIHLAAMTPQEAAEVARPLVTEVMEILTAKVIPYLDEVSSSGVQSAV